MTRALWWSEMEGEWTFAIRDLYQQTMSMTRLNLVLTALCTALLASASTSVSQAKSSTLVPERCEKPEGWLSGKFPVPEPGYYIPIAVRNRSYILMRRVEVSEGKLRTHLRRIRQELSVPQPIFLLSEPGLACSTFIKASQIVSSTYQCSRQRPCIWGYGLGEMARPSNVPAPPRSSMRRHSH